jgi:hypothetical protein
MPQKVDTDYNMFTGPNIVRDGLALYLDSTNSKSYPGSGNSWYDLSGNENHGTLINFTGAGAGTKSGFDTNTGYMMFDRHIGTSDSAFNNVVNIQPSESLNECLSQNGVTIEFWLRMDTYYCTAITRWAGPWEIYYCANLVHRTIGTGGSDGNSGYSYLNKFQTFHQVVATHTGTVRTLYVDNVNVLNQSNTVTNQNGNAVLPLGGYSNGQYAFFGAIPTFKLYNRVLTNDELTQNYNATKSRYGL